MMKIVGVLIFPIILLCCIVIAESRGEQGLFGIDTHESLTSTELKPGYVMGFVSGEVWYNSAISGSIAISMDPEVAMEKVILQ